MITGAMQNGLGMPVLFLGLSGDSVARLAAGEPIRISAAQMQEMGLPPMGVMLCYGATEESIIEELKANGVGIGEQLPPDHPQQGRPGK